MTHPPLQPFVASYDWQNQTAQSWYKYCPRCGSQLAVHRIDQHYRPTCPACGFVQFLNPSPTIAVYIIEHGSVLLGQRNSEPGKGLWATPSGYIEYNEDFVSAAVREAREETGLEVQIQSILHVESAFLDPQFHFLTIYLKAHVMGGEITDSDEHAYLAWFPLTGPLPPMAFSSDAAVIACLGRGDDQELLIPHQKLG